MDFRRKPNYADSAYREAVSRLKYFLAESYAPSKSSYAREVDSGGEETDNQSLLSGGTRISKHCNLPYCRYSPITGRSSVYAAPIRTTTTYPSEDINKNTITSLKSKSGDSQLPPELLGFIDKQEEYIQQLEKESRYCKDELASLLRKVKEVISENENLHEKQKSNLIKTVFSGIETETETETENDVSRSPLKKSPRSPKKKVTLEGPSIVFESRISELEAQLTQNRIELRKALDENESLRKRIADETGGGLDSHRRQLEAIQREKNALQDTVNKLQSELTHLKGKEYDTSNQIKRSISAVEHVQYEKNAAEQEIKRLKDEIERQHAKLRDTISDQSRRIADERNTIERRYSQQIEQLTAELGVQWEATSKLQMELDKQRRENSDLRRELAQKQAYADDLKKEMQNKIAVLQSELTTSAAEKSALEQQIATLQLSNERSERQLKQELARLQAEMQSMRQRLDRADADLIHSRRENIRLNEQIASLEKEININAALAEEKNKRKGEIMALPAPPSSKKEDKEKEVTSMIKEMEEKHVATVTELESMIHSQNQLMEKLTNECQLLTEKLEDASTRHKEEIRQLQANLDYLTNNLYQTQFNKDKKHDPGSTRPKSPLAKHPTNQDDTHSRQQNRIGSSSSQESQQLHSMKINQNISSASVEGNQQAEAPYESSYEQRSDVRYKQEDPGHTYIKELDQQHGQDSPQQYAQDSNEEYRQSQDQQYTDQSQHYIDNTNQQYSEYPEHHQVQDPNREYLRDTNQANVHYDQDHGYLQDTTQDNVRYVQDPNQQYVENQNHQYMQDSNRPPNEQYYPDYETSQYDLHGYQYNEPYGQSSNEEFKLHDEQKDVKDYAKTDE